MNSSGERRNNLLGGTAPLKPVDRLPAAPMVPLDHLLQPIFAPPKYVLSAEK